MRVLRQVIEQVKTDKIMSFICTVSALFFAFSLVFGKALDTVGELPIRNIGTWGAFLITFLLVEIVLGGLLCYVRSFPTVQVEASPISAYTTKRQTLQNVGVFLGFWICWLPSFLAVYPGFFLYDAYDEYMEVAKGVYTTHHPLLHVLGLGKMVDVFYHMTGSYNLGIAIYIMLQMLVAAGCFTYFIDFLRRKGVPVGLRIVTFIYLAFFPVNVMFTLCSAKDTAFALALFISVLQMIKYQDGNRERSNTIVGVVAMVLVLLYRNNALYGFVVFAIILLIYVGIIQKNRQAFVRMILLSVLICGFSAGISKGLAVSLHATKGGSQEMLTVPIQQIARCYKWDADSYSEEEKQILFSYLPETALAHYTPKLSDPVKTDFQNEVYASNKSGFWKMWWKGFRNNPVGYLNAWCMTSYGFWYPGATVDVYGGHSVFTHNYEKSSYFGFETEKPGTRDSKIPWLEEMYRVISLEGTVQKIPVVSWCFSMGALAFAYIICFNVLIARKRYDKLVPYMFPVLIWLTFLLGPTFLPRYVVFMWYMLPLGIIDAFVFARQR